MIVMRILLLLLCLFELGPFQGSAFSNKPSRLITTSTSSERVRKADTISFRRRSCARQCTTSSSHSSSASSENSSASSVVVAETQSSVSDTALWPSGDALDGTIWKIAFPAMLNLAILPLVGAADTFWVGRMKDALALAGQGAANQIFSSAFWIISFLPSVVTPLVAKAASENDEKQIQERVGEAMFLATIMGVIGMVGLSLLPHR